MTRQSNLPQNRSRPLPAGKAVQPAQNTKAKFTPATIITALILVSLAFGIGYGGMTLQADVAQPAALAGAPMQTFVVVQGDSLATVATRLEQQHIIRNALVLRYYSKYRKLSPALNPGTYQLSPSMTMTQILYALDIAPVRPTVSIRIPEGLRLTQYPNAIIQSALDATLNGTKAAALKNFSADDFLAYTVTGTKKLDLSQYWYVNPWDISSSGGAKALLEGYLVPDTYQIYTDASTVDIIDMMLDAFGERLCPGPDATHATQYIYNQNDCMAHQAMITPSSDANAPFVPISSSYQGDAGKAIGIFDALTAHNKMTLQQAMILGSLAQREARTPLHFELVASTYYNRWQNTTTDTVGFLGADPSEQYAIGSNAAAGADPWAPLNNPGDSGNSPYNLSTKGGHKGLPPSAIDGMSLSAFYAGIDPPSSNYYYFFFGKDCTNHYYQYGYQQTYFYTKYGVNNGGCNT